MTMNQGTAEPPFPPWVKSLMALGGIAGGVYLEADKHRKARVTGVEVAPESPLDSLLGQSGLHIPKLEAILARMMGDTPDAKEAASVIVNSRDSGSLLREFAARFAAGEPLIDQKTEQKPSDAGASTSSATPGAEQASTSAPPNSATPPTSTPPTGAASAPSATPPPPTEPPAPDRGPVFHPPHTFRGNSAQPQARPGSPPLYRSDYATAPSGHPPLYRSDYAEPAPSDGWPTPRPFGAAHSPSAQAPSRGRVPPPPIFRSCAGTSAKSTTTTPSQRLSRRPPASTMPTGRTSTTRPPAATTTGPASATEPAPATDAPRPEATDPSMDPAPRSFLDWMKDKLAMVERQREADLAELRRTLADGLHRLEKVEAIVDRLEADQRDAATIPIDTASATSMRPEAAQAAAEPADAATTKTETPDDKDAIRPPERDLPLDEVAVQSQPVPASPTTTPPPAVSDTSVIPLDEPLDETPPLPTLEEMVETTHLVVIHQQRLRELDAEARQERDDYIRRVTRVEDRCTALALAAPAREHNTP